MRIVAVASTLVLALAVSAPLPAAGGEDPSRRTVVVLLFDGFAPSLIDEFPTPAFATLRAEGAWTHHLVPVFPTISHPNQVSISTGCWPAHHGIVSNSFLDPERGLFDHSRDADWISGCEPLNVVAERQGVRTAVLGWVGRYSSTRGELASETSRERRFADFPTDDARADEVVRLLERPAATRPRLILAYFLDPDLTEHYNGLDTAATGHAVAASDAAIGKILAALRRLDDATLIVTTDHGMVPVTTNVNVAKILANHRIHARAVSRGTTSFLYFSDPTERERAVSELASYSEFEVVRREAQPVDWHLGTSARVGDLILSARPPYFMEDIDAWPWWVRWLGAWGPEFLWAKPILKATHGYPAETPGIAGLLYAWGSGIAVGREVDAIRVIDVHPTVAHLLGIASGTPVDGTVARGLLAP